MAHITQRVAKLELILRRGVVRIIPKVSRDQAVTEAAGLVPDCGTWEELAAAIGCGEAAIGQAGRTESEIRQSAAMNAAARTIFEERRV